jgi:hypothetical protein
MNISGTIKDKSDSPIVGSSVYASDVNGGVTDFPRKADADKNGNYAISVNQGEYLTAMVSGKKIITIMPINELVDFVILPPADNIVNTTNVTVKKPFPWQNVVAALIAIAVITYLFRSDKN